MILSTLTNTVSTLLAVIVLALLYRAESVARFTRTLSDSCATSCARQIAFSSPKISFPTLALSDDIPDHRPRPARVLRGAGVTSVTRGQRELTPNAGAISTTQSTNDFTVQWQFLLRQTYKKKCIHLCRLPRSICFEELVA